MSSSPVPTTVPVTKVDVILKTSADWEMWINFIRVNARIEEIWDFMNPNLPVEPELPQVPLRPKPSSIKHGALTAADLDEKQLKLFELTMNNYYKDVAVYTKTKEALKHFSV